MSKISDILEDLMVNINEMPTVGSPLKNSGKVVQVYGTEGKGHPHFHVKLNKRSRFGDTCICIKDAKYFPHGTHTGRLEKSELIDLVTMLKQYNTNFRMTNWELLLADWNQENNDDLDLSLEMPDYLNMKKDDVVK